MGQRNNYFLGILISIVFLLIGLFKGDFSYIIAAIVWFIATLALADKEND